MHSAGGPQMQAPRAAADGRPGTEGHFAGLEAVIGAGAFDEGGGGFGGLLCSGTRLGKELGVAVECLQARAAAHAVRMAGVSAKRRKQLEAHLHAHGGVVGTAAVTADIEAKERAAAAAAVGARARRAPAVPCGKAPDGRKSPKTRTRKRRRGRGRPLLALGR